MFSGYLQAAVYTGLNGVMGKKGWQWLFIMDGVISLPICLLGFFLIPDLPENTRAFYLSAEDRLLAVKRMNDIGRAPRRKLGWSIIKRVFMRWHVYALAILYIIAINAGSSSSINAFALWLKSQGYSIPQINVIPTGSSLVQLISTITLAILSDFLRSRALAMSIATSFGFLAYLLLAIWHIPTSLKFFAFFLKAASIGYSPLSMSWANEICSADAEERALVLGMMNASGYAVNTWLPFLTYPAVDAPRFKRGFTFSTVAYGMQFLITGLVAGLWRREKRMKEREGEGGSVVEGGLVVAIVDA